MRCKLVCSCFARAETLEWRPYQLCDNAGLTSSSQFLGHDRRISCNGETRRVELRFPRGCRNRWKLRLQGHVDSRWG